MDYYKILNLIKEPFSNSPDPDFLYESPQHTVCRQKLEIAVRLLRGLNIVIGDVGTGKTTLCRQLMRRFAGDHTIRICLLLDPYFSNSLAFLSSVGEMLGIEQNESISTEWQRKESIKHHLFDESVNKKRITVFIIDEGQKIPDFCIEILREFLNYETNQHKLLQIIIFAQKELKQRLSYHPGFTDRVNLFYNLSALNFNDTKSMIRFRIQKASESGNSPVHFSGAAFLLIYQATHGYPRKIVRLCHQIMLALIIQNRSVAGWKLVRSCIKRNDIYESKRISWNAALGVICVALIAVVTVSGTSKLKTFIPDQFYFSHLFPLKHTELSYLEAAETPSINGVALRGENKEINDKKQLYSIIAKDQPIQPVDYPFLLGQLVIRDLGTVGEMIEDIYGTCTLRHLRLVTEVNTHLENLDQVFAGDVIKFPPVPEKIKSSTRSCCWVQVTEMDNLEDAYNIIKEISYDGIRLKMLSYWNSKHGLKFAILLKDRYINEKEARNSIDQLPQCISTDAKIVSTWDEGTIFFSII